MRRLGKLLLIVGLALGGLAIVKREALLRLHAVNTLFAEDRIVRNFSTMNQMFNFVPLSRGTGPASPLPQGSDITLPPGYNAWVRDRQVTSVVVLRDGAVVHEAYYLGTGPQDLRISWSVAKSFLSALIGVLLDEGKITSLDDPVTRYAPALIGGAYDGATIRDVLQMSSGVTFDEDYLDFWSDINKMGRILALGGSMDGFATDLTERFQPPGTGFKYVSIDTHVLGMVARGATGQSVAQLLSDRVLTTMGLEAEPYYLTDGYGVAFVLGGLNMTTRDYARLGLMYLQDGRLNGQQIIPQDWVRESTTPSAKTAAGALQYGYQWWMPEDAIPGEFLARGVYGQYVYVNRADGVVIATTAADRGFRAPGVTEFMIDPRRDINQAARQEAKYWKKTQV